MIVTPYTDNNCFPYINAVKRIRITVALSKCSRAVHLRVIDILLIQVPVSYVSI